MPQLELRSRTVLIVDDNRNRIALLRRVLRDLGVSRILENEAPVEAVETLKRSFIDIAFVEKDILATDGFMFARMVRYDQMTQNAFMPIVLMCTTVDRPTIMKAINVGIDAVMAKPLSNAEVGGKLGSLLGRPLTYIRTASGYFGPDRRRRADPGFKGHDRRKDDRAVRLGPGAELVHQATWPGSRAQLPPVEHPPVRLAAARSADEMPVVLRPHPPQKRTFAQVL